MSAPPTDPNCIFACYAGSVAHGTHNPDPESIDDIDLLGCVTLPLGYYFGLNAHGYGKGTKEVKEGRYDIVYHETRKFVRLLAQGNPNLIVSLWVKPEHILVCTDAGRTLLDHRDLFAGKHVYGRFLGYARGQMKRMTNPDARYQGYMGPKRRQLVDAYGYDTKNASHMVRLLRLCIEFLETGFMTVDRAGIDGAELRAIKNGAFSLPSIQQLAGDLFDRASAAYNASTLPDGPDMDAINALCTQIIEQTHGARRS